MATLQRNHDGTFRDNQWEKEINIYLEPIASRTPYFSGDTVWCPFCAVVTSLWTALLSISTTTTTVSLGGGFYQNSYCRNCCRFVDIFVVKSGFFLPAFYPISRSTPSLFLTSLRYRIVFSTLLWYKEYFSFI